MPTTNQTATATLGCDRLLGFAIVGILPAAFWTAVLAAVSHALGSAMSAPSLIGSGVAILSAMSVLFAALQINPRD